MKEEYQQYYTQLGRKIAYYRKLAGYTQEQLAEKIGKSWSFIAQIEGIKTATGVSLDTLFDIAKALDIPVYKFFVFD